MAGKFFDDELNSEEYEILKGFYPKAKNLTIKEIRKKTSYSSYERVNHYLKQLAKKGVVSEKKMGKTLVYSLRPETWSSRMAFYLYSVERAREFAKKYPTIYNALKKIPEENLDILIIFGSYAKGTETKKSDIDILAVSNEMEKVERLIRSLKHSYNLDFSPIVMERTEFAKIKNENKIFWDDIIEFARVFKGQDMLYYYIYLT